MVINGWKFTENTGYMYSTTEGTTRDPETPLEKHGSHKLFSIEYSGDPMLLHNSFATAASLPDELFAPACALFVHSD